MKNDTVRDEYYRKTVCFPFADYRTFKTFCQTHERGDELMRADIALHDPFQRLDQGRNPFHHARTRQP